MGGKLQARRTVLWIACCISALVARTGDAAEPEWFRLHAEAIGITQEPGAQFDETRMSRAAEKLTAALAQHDDPALVWDLANVEKLRRRHARAFELLARLVATWPEYEKVPKAQLYLRDLSELMRLAPEVRIETEPSGAEVTLKNKDRSLKAGPTPVRDLYAPIGQYDLCIQLAGYLPVEEAVDVKEGKALAIKRALVSESRAGTLEIRVAPPGLRVELDGRALGTSPLQRSIRVPAGEHVLRVVDTAGASQDRRTTLRAGQTISLAIDAPEANSRVGPWIVIGAGGAAAVAGGVLLGLAVGKSGDADDAERDSNRAFDAGDVATGNRQGKASVDLSNDAQTYGTAGYVVGGIGLAAVGAGLWWWLSGRDTAEAPAESTTFVPLTNGFGLVRSF